jgi:hypothetical protein
MESTLIGMRHKNNMSNILLYDQSLFYNFDLTNTSKYKNFSLSPGKIYTYKPLNFSGYTKLTTLNSLGVNFVNPYTTLTGLLKDLFYFLHIPTSGSLISFIGSFSYVKSFSTTTLYLFSPTTNNLLNNLYTAKGVNSNTNSTLSVNVDNVYTSSSLGYSDYNSLLSSNFSETSTS